MNASARDLQRYVDASNHSLLDELLDDLGETRRKIFVFCNVPQQWHHELGLCVVLFARVEHNFVVGVDLVNLLASTSLFLLNGIVG